MHQKISFFAPLIICHPCFPVESELDDITSFSNEETKEVLSYRFGKAWRREKDVHCKFIHYQQ